MSLNKDPQIITIKERLREGMIDFISEDTAYSEEDVKQVMRILDNYLEEQNNTQSKEESLSLVKTTVEALNDLNEKAEFELIETEQREDICEIIIRAGYLRGFNDEDDDVTGEWRDW